MAAKYSQIITVQLEYINHLLKFFKNISYYAGIMLNALVIYYAQNYAGIIGWSLLIIAHYYLWLPVVTHNYITYS